MHHCVVWIQTCCHCIAIDNKPTGLGLESMFLHVCMHVYDLYCTVYECFCIVCWLLLQYHTHSGPKHCVLVCRSTTRADNFYINVRKYDSTRLCIYVRIKAEFMCYQRESMWLPSCKARQAITLCCCFVVVYIYVYISRPSQLQTPRLCNYFLFFAGA